MHSFTSSTIWFSLRRFASGVFSTVVQGTIGFALIVVAALSAFPFFDLPEPAFRVIVLSFLGAIVVFLVVERGVVERLVTLDAVHGALHEAHEVNVVAARVLIASASAKPDDRIVHVAMLPGHSGQKRQPLDSQPGLELFRKQLVKLATDDGWHVRQLLNFNSPDEVERWLVSYRAFAKAARFEARAYTTDTSLPILAPLIVANEHVLLANEDRREARLRTAVHLQGRHVAKWATTYFDDLWENAPFRLRGYGDLDMLQVESIRNQFSPSR